MQRQRHSSAPQNAQSNTQTLSECSAILSLYKQCLIYNYVLCIRLNSKRRSKEWWWFLLQRDVQVISFLLAPFQGRFQRCIGMASASDDASASTIWLVSKCNCSLSMQMVIVFEEAKRPRHFRISKTRYRSLSKWCAVVPGHWRFHVKAKCHKRKCLHHNGTIGRCRLRFWCSFLVFFFGNMQILLQKIFNAKRSRTSAEQRKEDLMIISVNDALLSDRKSSRFDSQMHFEQFSFCFSSPGNQLQNEIKVKSQWNVQSKSKTSTTTTATRQNKQPRPCNNNDSQWYPIAPDSSSNYLKKIPFGSLQFIRSTFHNKHQHTRPSNAKSLFIHFQPSSTWYLRINTLDSNNNKA